jgi:hypothetical protein
MRYIYEYASVTQWYRVIEEPVVVLFRKTLCHEWNQKVDYRIQKNTPLAPILSHNLFLQVILILSPIYSMYMFSI